MKKKNRKNKRKKQQIYETNLINSMKKKKEIEWRKIYENQLCKICYDFFSIVLDVFGNQHPHLHHTLIHT